MFDFGPGQPNGDAAYYRIRYLFYITYNELFRLGYFITTKKWHETNAY